MDAGSFLSVLAGPHATAQMGLPILIVLGKAPDATANEKRRSCPSRSTFVPSLSTPPEVHSKPAEPHDGRRWRPAARDWVDQAPRLVVGYLAREAIAFPFFSTGIGAAFPFGNGPDAHGTRGLTP